MATDTSKAPLHPSVLWAETKAFIFITVELHEVQNLNVDLQQNSLDFSATADEQPYAFQLQFPHEIDKEESKYNRERNVQIKLVKKEPQRWGKLTTEKAKLHWLKCDWQKWLDSEGEEDGAMMNTGDFDMGSMDFGGGGMGGMMDDSDDEPDLPDLNNHDGLDGPDSDKDMADLEENEKEAGEKEAGEKEAGEKEAGEKEASNPKEEEG